jgi:hypothetical protein
MRHALLLALLLPLGGCVLTTAWGQALTGITYPPQQARVVAHGEGLALRVEETGGARTALVSIAARDPSALEVTGGPVTCTCRCYRSAYGLVRFDEGLPFRVYLPDGVVEAEPIADEPPLAAVVVAWLGLPVTAALDLGLLPLELVFVLTRT